MAQLTAEQIAAWNRISPETVIGNPAASLAQEREADALEALADLND